MYTLIYYVVICVIGVAAKLLAASWMSQFFLIFFFWWMLKLNASPHPLCNYEWLLGYIFSIATFFFFDWLENYSCHFGLTPHWSGGEVNCCLSLQCKIEGIRYLTRGINFDVEAHAQNKLWVWTELCAFLIIWTQNVWDGDWCNRSLECKGLHCPNVASLQPIWIAPVALHSTNRLNQTTQRSIFIIMFLCQAQLLGQHSYGGQDRKRGSKEKSIASSRKGSKSGKKGSLAPVLAL